MKEIEHEQKDVKIGIVLGIAFILFKVNFKLDWWADESKPGLKPVSGPPI
jgi:hypothetical protein